MTDLTSLWHAAAPAPPPGKPASSSRPPSPSKSPLGRILRSVSPAPPSRRYSDIPRDRSQSLQFDAAARGGDLPPDTFSPEPERPSSRASAASAGTSHSHRQTRVSGPSRNEQPAIHASTYDTASPSRNRTMSFTPGDSYAPWGVHQSSSTLSSVSTTSSASLHQQWQQQQQRPSSPAVHHPYQPTSQPQVPQATGFAPPTPHSSSPQPYAYPHSQQQHQHAQPRTLPAAHNSPIYSAQPLPTPPPGAVAQPYLPQQPSTAPAHWSPATAFSPLPGTSQPLQSHWSPAAANLPLVSSPQTHHAQLPMQPTPPPSSFAPNGVPFPTAATPGAPANTQVWATSQQPGPSPPIAANATSLSRQTPGSVRRSLPQPPGPPGVTRPPVIPQASALSRPPMSTPPPQSPASPAPSGPLPPASSSPAPVPPPRSNTSTPSSGSSISRADSVRMAAEELMAKGPPRRGRGGPSRFSRSPLNPSSSSASVESSTSQSDANQPSVRSSQSEPAQVVPQTPARTESNSGHAAAAPRDPAVSLAQAAEQMSLQDSGSKSTTPALPEPPQPPARPSSRGPRDDVLHDREPQNRTAPATFALAQQEVEAERRRRPLPQHNAPATSVAAPEQPVAGPQSTPGDDGGAGLAPVSEVPKIFSPPPNAAPPVPSIAFPDEDYAGSPVHPNAPAIAISAPDAGPQISVTPAEAPSAPAISISGADDDDDDGPSGPVISVSGPDDAGDVNSGPMISVSGPDDDGEDAVGMTPSVSLSHAADHVPAVPQRASATTSSDAAYAPSGRAGGDHGGRGGPQQTASSVAGTVCGTCNKYVAGRVVQAIGQSFHPGCFSCNYCGELLEHVAFYEHEGKAYCHFDYHELFSLRCFHCRTPIVDERFIQINDPELVQAHAAHADKAGKQPASAAVRYYHDLHFFCANCGDPFMDPKVASSTAGSERGKIQVDAEGRVLSGSKAFVVWKGYPYCEGCHDNLHKPRCKACKRPILGDVITALKGKWHPECFVCTGCSRPFEDERVFVDAKGNGYDEECYKVWLRNQL